MRLIVALLLIPSLSYAQDFDDSGLVDFNDFLLFVSSYGTLDSRYDLNNNGVVDFPDFLLFVSEFGNRSPEIAFNIDLLFVDDTLTSHQKEVIRKAARRWEEVIVEDLPDMDFSGDSFVLEIIKEYGISTPKIDDIVIRVKAEYLGGYIYGLGGPDMLYGPGLERNGYFLPYFGEITINTTDEVLNDDAILFSVALHEMGHALGIGTLTYDRLVVETTADGKVTDAYFPGIRAIEAFNKVGGEGYTGGGKVPMDTESEYVLPPYGVGDHWRSSIFGNELMCSRSSSDAPLSIVTIQALADLGYVVDASKADPFLIRLGSSKIPVTHIRCGNGILSFPK